MQTYRFPRCEYPETENIDGYNDIYPDESCLDGWFTAEQLRAIADAMDKEKGKKCT